MVIVHLDPSGIRKAYLCFVIEIFECMKRTPNMLVLHKNLRNYMIQYRAVQNLIHLVSCKLFEPCFPFYAICVHIALP